MKKLLLIALLFCGIITNPELMAQSKSGAKKGAESAARDTELLSNEKVIALFKAGLQKEIIVTTIRSTESKFDLSVNAMLALKKQGIPDEVISAMVNKSTGSSVAVTKSGASKEAGIADNRELAKLDPGIYHEAGAGKEYAVLEASVFSQSKVGSGILSGLTYGIAKTKAKAVLSGARSNMVISTVQPVFYFIFPKGGTNGLGNEGSQGLWYSNASSPNEFIMIKFKSIDTKKQKGREVVTGSFGTYSGFSGGIPDESKVQFRYSKIASGVYKVYFEAPVEEGEYAFIFAGQSTAAVGGAPSQKAFDFSVAQP